MFFNMACKHTVCCRQKKKAPVATCVVAADAVMLIVLAILLADLDSLIVCLSRRPHAGDEEYWILTH